MKIKSNKNILKSIIMNEGKELEKYKMQKALLGKVAMRLIDDRKYDMLAILRAREEHINGDIMFYTGMITAYKVSLSLMR